MSEEDRYSIAEFARRYKLAEARLPAFCELFGVEPDTELSRSEFKTLLDRFEQDSAEASEPPSPQPSPTGGGSTKPKEDQVPKKKQALAQWVKEKITHARVFKTAYLKSAMGWQDDTKLSEDEFDNAVRKHLLNKE